MATALKQPGQYVRDEIAQQPEGVARMLASQHDVARQIARAIAQRGIRHVVIAARGTSDNAARYAQYVWGGIVGLNVALATPSLWSVYGSPPGVADCLVVGISQSGQSPDIVSVVDGAARQGAVTLAITNDTSSPLATAAKHVVSLEAGVERAVAATKTYTAQLAAVALLAATLASHKSLLHDLNAIPDAMAAALMVDQAVGDVADELATAQQCLAIGRGYNLATAFELALKLQEMCYITVGQYSSADFRHGPMALSSPDMPAIVVAPTGAVSPGLHELVLDLEERGTRVVAISDDAWFDEPTRRLLRLPTGTPEWVSPLTAIIPCQLLALHIALSKGIDPDLPRGLSKVTLTS